MNADKAFNISSQIRCIRTHQPQAHALLLALHFTIMLGSIADVHATTRPPFRFYVVRAINGVSGGFIDVICSRV